MQSGREIAATAAAAAVGAASLQPGKSSIGVLMLDLRHGQGAMAGTLAATGQTCTAGLPRAVDETLTTKFSKASATAATRDSPDEKIMEKIETCRHSNAAWSGYEPFRAPSEVMLYLWHWARGHDRRPAPA